MTWRQRLTRLEEATARPVATDADAWQERLNRLLADPEACDLAAAHAVAYARTQGHADPELRELTERLEAYLAGGAL